VWNLTALTDRRQHQTRIRRTGIGWAQRLAPGLPRVVTV
jgi:hypothetical protein